MNIYDLILLMWITILTSIFIYFVIDMLGRTKKLKNTVDEFTTKIKIDLDLKTNNIRQLVYDEIVNKKERRSMNKYIKKPIEVEALQIHGNASEIKEFIGENGNVYIHVAAWEAGADCPHTSVIIHTLEGDMKATDGDYIIKGVKGEFYPCRKDIFEETYELAESEVDE